MNPKTRNPSTAEYQAHGGAVNTGTTPKVGYGYADGAANTVRAVGLEYPDGRQLEYSDGAAGGDGDQLSRIDSIDDTVGGPRVAYLYLGLDDFVQADYPEPEVRWDLITGSGANPYAGLDRFDRVIDCLWRRYGGTPANLDRFQYGYDRASNRIWRKNDVAPAGHDELYAYDRLHRLIEMARGTLSTDRQHVDNMQFTQDWTLDATGNWNRLTQTVAATPGENLDQSRWQNPANEITRIARRYGTDWATPEYDRAGNMTVIPKPAEPTTTFTGTYDAWNRLVHLSDINATYRYDALYRRVTKDVDSTHRHFYYTADWQCLEERLNSSTDPDRQYLWGLRYIDDLVLRDRDTNADGTLDERLCVLQDANWNVTAIVDDEGEVEERFGYTAYGVTVALTPSFAPRDLSESDWATLYAAYAHEAESGLFFVRFRHYHPAAGIWTTRDPLEYATREYNLYRYARNTPVNGVDPYGLDVWIENTQADVPGELHQRICVDTWCNDCTKKLGKYCISFGMGEPPGEPIECDDPYFPFEEDPEGNGAVFGDVKDPASNRPLAKLFSKASKIKQNCEQDKAVLRYFFGLKNRRARYDALTQNCRQFSRKIHWHIRTSERYKATK